jgi:inorganic phosphate transporter, PiT family
LLPIDTAGIIIAFGLIAFAAGNNIVICSGAMISSRVTTRRVGILITVIGYSLGLGLQGTSLRLGVLAIAPGISEVLVILSMFVSLLIFLVAYVTRAPLPLSIIFAGGVLGAALASGAFIHLPFLYLVAATWIIAPIVAVLAAIGISHVWTGNVAKGHVWNYLSLMKALIIVVSFFTAYTLGANTFGFVYSALRQDSVYTLALLIIAAIVGGSLLGSRQLRVIGDKIITLRYKNVLNSQLVSSLIVETATFMRVPLSNTQTLTAAILGSGLSYRERLIGIKTIKRVVASWIIGFAASFLLSYGFALVLVHASIL